MWKIFLLLGKSFILSTIVYLSNNTFFFAVLCILQLSHIDAQWSRVYCENIYNDCQRFTSRIGRFDETIDSFNRHCRRERRGRWNSVSRCEMEKATCLRESHFQFKSYSALTDFIF